MKRILSLLFPILLFSQFLAASTEGRIEGDGIPSLRGDFGLEYSEMLYVAPVAQYYAVDFGLFTYRYRYSGIVLGGMAQWIDGDYVSGTIGVRFLMGGDRDFTRFAFGVLPDINLQAGSRTGGFCMSVRSPFFLPSGGSKSIDLEGGAGVYYSPLPHVTVKAQPGFGYRFGDEDGFFFNFMFSMEAYLWR